MFTFVPSYVSRHFLNSSRAISLKTDMFKLGISPSIVVQKRSRKKVKQAQFVQTRSHKDDHTTNPNTIKVKLTNSKHKPVTKTVNTLREQKREIIIKIS